MKIKFFAFLLSFFVLLTAGCNSSPTIDDDDYLSMAPEDQATYIAEIRARADALLPKRQAEYDAGLPVASSQGGTKIVVQRDALTGIAMVSAERSDGAFKPQSRLMMAVPVDESGNRIGNATLASAMVSQSGLGDRVVDKVFGLGNAALHGAVAAEIHAGVCRGGNCGGGGSVAIAVSGAESNSSLQAAPY